MKIIFNIFIIVILFSSCMRRKKENFTSHLKKSYKAEKVYNVGFLMKAADNEFDLNKIERYFISDNVFNSILELIENKDFKRVKVDDNTEYLGSVLLENKYVFDIILFRKKQNFKIYLISKKGNSVLISELKYDESLPTPHILNNKLFIFQNISGSEDHVQSYRYEVISVSHEGELFSESTIKSDSILKSYLIHD